MTEIIGLPTPTGGPAPGDVRPVVRAGSNGAETAFAMPLSMDAAFLPNAPNGVPLAQMVADQFVLRCYGYIGNGVSNPVGSLYPTLAAAQAIYPSALALTDEIDGLAIQTVIDNATASLLQLEFPPGTAMCSRPLVTPGSLNVVIRGASAGVTNILAANPGTDGWQHGLATPGQGRFEAHDIGFRCTGVGGTALNLAFSGAVPALQLDGVEVFGWANETSDYWTYGVQAIDAAASKIYRSRFGGIISGTPISSNGLVFTSNTGSAVQMFFSDLQILGFNYAFEFLNNDAPGIEGVFMRGVNVNSCNGFITQMNPGYPTTGYQPPQWVFDHCEWETFGQTFNFTAAYGIWISNCLGYQLGGSGYNVMQFTNCYGVVIRSTMFQSLQAATPLNLIHVGLNCQDFDILDNFFYVFGSLSGQGVLIDSGNLAVVEAGSHFPVFPSTTAKVTNNAQGSGSGSVSITNALYDGAQAFHDGTILFAGTATGAVNISGQLSVGFPSGLFSAAPATLLVVNGDYGTTGVEPQLLWGYNTAAGFVVAFPGVPSGTNVRVNYLARST
jgi:hypothetical protein